MPRRAPPTALRLVPGPAPPRNAPKHVLPAPPQPVQMAPVPVKKTTPEPPTFDPMAFFGEAPSDRVLGPWAHSSGLRVAIPIGRLLAPPAPVHVIQRCSS
ncbi:hypothetical protein BKA70DRAFT_1248205 [Coprinopsis sp. MPI-PUGE-AT-0042]|nr:hypothetical protein BKA70DRAFT_1248205 [Coprinopsis sp. MPI-PUGE-AT-0042]